MLAAAYAATAVLSRCRAHVVIEGRGERRTACRAHDLGAFRVVAANHLIMVEKIEIGARQGTRQQFETVAGERAAFLHGKAPRVPNRHRACFQIDTLPVIVATFAVAARQDPAVAVERGLHGRPQVVE